MRITREPLLAFIVLIIVYSLTTNYIIAKKRTIYNILHWTYYRKYPYLYAGPGRKQFIDNHCKFTNCYVTNNKQMFPLMTDYDAILFDQLDLNNITSRRLLPGKLRSPTQKYIFTSTETAANFPLCKSYLDNYFNWTWTFRLDSDIKRGYITVYNLKGKIVGPKKNTTWLRTMKPTGEEIKLKLRHKFKLAAWFVSHCKTREKRRVFINRVQEVLTQLGDYKVDIFGRCGPYKCPRGSSNCSRMLQRDYYFYMAFENSFAPDYITEKVMTALDNYNVPVVYGAADYNTILPPGSYLNARELGPEKLAQRMVEIKANVSAYHDFFRWRNHFKYKETTYTDDVCALCAIMNDDKKRMTSSTHHNFLKWWNEGECIRRKANIPRRIKGLPDLD